MTRVLGSGVACARRQLAGDALVVAAGAQTVPRGVGAAWTTPEVAYTARHPAVTVDERSLDAAVTLRGGTAEAWTTVCATVVS